MTDPILKLIADNPALFDALKTVCLAQFDPRTANLPDDASDEVYGQFLRSRLAGIHAVEDAFREIAKHKSAPEPSVKRNEAR